MKWSRNYLASVLALAFAVSSCANLAPKADVSIGKVAVDLAFGVDVEELLEPPPLPPPPPPNIFIPPDEPPPLPPPPPPPPPTPFCPGVQTNSPRDGQAPPSVRPGPFDPDDPERGGNWPRRGQYPTFYQGNYAGEPSKSGYDYKRVGVRRDNESTNSFFYTVIDEGHGVTMEYTIIYPSQASENAESSNAEVAGIYLRSIRIPLAADKTQSRVFIPANAETGGLKLASFPLGAGQRTDSTQPNRAANDVEVEGQQLPLAPPSSTISTSVIVAQPQNVFVCDQMAQAWRFNTSIEITGDVEVSLIGSFWMATQYGGWSIQEVFSIDGGNTFISGNFLARLARLDPGEVL
ncbi:MAG: hypothetical protein ACLGH3_01200 [Actinomycetota bacterium]